VSVLYSDLCLDHPEDGDLIAETCSMLQVYVRFLICFVHLLVSANDHMVQALSHRPVTVEARVQSQASPCGICGARSDTRILFLRILRMFPVSIIQPTLRTDPVMFRNQGCVNSGLQVAMILNGAFYGSSDWNLLIVHRILSCILAFLNICAPLTDAIYL
jgi:hypothetical protein